MNRLKYIAIVLCAMLLSGCFAHNPYRYDSSAVTGAAVGALVGGIAGYAIGNSYSRNDYRDYPRSHNYRRRNRGYSYYNGRRNYGGRYCPY